MQVITSVESRSPPAPATTWPVRRWVSGVDLLRGAAALAVVLDHSAQQAFPGGPVNAGGRVVWWLGSWGVTLFFVISGFCIHLPRARRQANGDDAAINWAHFFLRRVRRLLPAHYCALVVAAMVGHYATTNLVGPATPRMLAAHIVMVHPWIGESYFYGINAVFWSIAVEVHFYILYPVFLWLRAKLQARVVLLLFVVGLAFYGLASRVHDHDARFVLQHIFIVTWWQWALGALLADIYASGYAGRWARMLADPRAGLAVVLGSIAIGAVDPVVLRLHVRYWILPMFCFLILANIMQAAAQPSRSMRWLSRLGHASYSLYLVHPVAIAATWMLLTRHWAARGHSTGSFMMYVSASLLLCGAFYYLVERHFISAHPLESSAPGTAARAAESAMWTDRGRRARW